VWHRAPTGPSFGQAQRQRSAMPRPSHRHEAAHLRSADEHR